MANPQVNEVTTPEAVQAVNAKWVNGIAPGYAPLAGAGLNLNLGAGSAFDSGTIVNYAGGSLALTNNTTNYVYLDSAAAYAPSFNITGFLPSHVPIAIVVTAAGAITLITDERLSFSIGGGGLRLGFQLSSQPPANTRYLVWEFTETINFAANFANSRGKCLTAPTNPVTFTVEKNGVTVGTVSIAITGVFTFSTTGGVSVTYSAGDWLSVITPVSQDLTLADIGFVLRGR